MITVSTMVGRRFVDVSNELWLFIGVDLRFWALMTLVENDHVTAVRKPNGFILLFFFPIRSSTARSRPARGSTPRQSQGSSSTPTNPLPTTVPTVTMTGPTAVPPKKN